MEKFFPVFLLYLVSALPAIAQEPNLKFDALIYQGEATATGDPEAITEILTAHGRSYQIASSQEMNSLSPSDLEKYQTIIWPGGYAGYMSGSLTAATRGRIRQAVVEKGVSYVGICAGAFLAVSPAANSGEEGPAWGFSLIAGDLLPYYHLENEGTEYAMVPIQLSGSKPRSLLWWGGPSLPEFEHGVIARYSDSGDPAITQTLAGKGLVIFSGPHPEAPVEWRTKLGLYDPEGLEQDIASDLFEAAITRKILPALN
jgi:glutamine amidotransferase-like uncharacterized protein